MQHTSHITNAPHRVKVGIRLKVFLFSLVLIAVSMLAAETYLAQTLEEQLTARIRADLVIRARLVAQRVAARVGALDEQATADALADEMAAAAGVRVTLVHIDGTVMGDSEVDVPALSALENHAARPELVDALARGEGTSVRYSTTTGSRMIYAAVPI